MKPGIFEKEYWASARYIYMYMAYTKNKQISNDQSTDSFSLAGKAVTRLVHPSMARQTTASQPCSTQRTLPHRRRLRLSRTVARDVTNLIAVVATHVWCATPSTSSRTTTTTTTGTVGTVTSKMAQLIAPTHKPTQFTVHWMMELITNYWNLQVHICMQGSIDTDHTVRFIHLQTQITKVKYSTRYIAKV